MPPPPILPMPTSVAAAPTGRDGAAVRPGAEMLVARVGGERFAFPLRALVEFVEAPAAVPAPQQPAGVLGLLATRLGRCRLWSPAALLGQAGGPTPAVALVFEREGAVAALAVDALGDVIALGADDVRPVAGLDDPWGVVRGAARTAEGLVTVVDAERLMAVLTRERSA